MYTRSGQGRFPRDLRVPKNYAGNAFRPPLAEKELQEPIFVTESFEEPQTQKQEITSAEMQDTVIEAERDTKITDNSNQHKQTEDKHEAKQTGLFSFPKFDIGLGKLFSRGGINIGFEELLLLGLIILIASEGKGDDLILLLILLLFIQ